MSNGKDSLQSLKQEAMQDEKLGDKWARERKALVADAESFRKLLSLVDANGRIELTKSGRENQDYLIEVGIPKPFNTARYIRVSLQDSISIAHQKHVPKQ